MKLRPLPNRIPGFSFRKAPRWLLICTLLALLGGLPVYQNVGAAAGDLDLSFDGDGIAVTDSPNVLSGFNDMAIQPDGKIVVAGGTDIAFLVIRYNPDGSLDSSFGNGGKVVANSPFSRAFAIALQPDGRILIAGSSFVGTPTGTDFSMMRFNSDGTIDNSFGNNGLVTTEMFASDRATDIALQSDGKIVLVGEAGLAGRYGLARYDTSGNLDPSFGDGGKVVSVLFSSNDHATAVAIQADGKIVVTGLGNGDFEIARFTTTGSLDNTFDSDGKLLVDFSGRQDQADEVLIQPDGKILVAGGSFGESTAGDFALVRCNHDGSLDSGFGTGGKVLTALSAAYDVIFGLTLQSDGKIIAGGYTQDPSLLNLDFAMVRYQTNGTPDSSFGTNGFVKTDFGSLDARIDAVALQTDGKIVVAGTAHNRVTFAGSFVVARYQTDGVATFDICVQDDKSGSILQFNTITGQYQFTNCRKGYTFSGVGTVTTNFCKITLAGGGPGNFVTALANSCTRKATATVTATPSGKIDLLTDSDMNNNACACR